MNVHHDSPRGFVVYHVPQTCLTTDLFFQSVSLEPILRNTFIGLHTEVQGEMVIF